MVLHFSKCVMVSKYNSVEYTVAIQIRTTTAGVINVSTYTYKTYIFGLQSSVILPMYPAISF